jgi:uncharacterized membrane protein YphA (DoxX/SURF4 family)
MLWPVYGLVAPTFVVAGLGKVAAIEPSPTNFKRWGISMRVMRLIGALEMLGGVGVCVPQVSGFAAIGLVLVMLGALRTGVVFKEPLHIILPAVLIALLGILIYARFA